MGGEEAAGLESEADREKRPRIVLIYVESFAPPALAKTQEAHESRERSSAPGSEAVVVG